MQRNEKNFRATLFCDDFYPVIDGVVKVVNNCAKHINALDDADCEIVVPQYGKENFDDSIFPYKVLRKPTTVIKFNKYPVPFPKRKKGLAKEIIDFNADIYHAHSPFFLGDYAIKLAKKQGIPVVATFHSQFREDFLQVTHSKLLTKMLLRRVVRFFNKCDDVWAPSAKSADTLHSYGYQKPIYVMDNGTDFAAPANLSELQDEVRKKYGIDPKNKNLLYVGQIRFIKNLRLSLETVAELVKTDPSYRFYLVGEGCNEDDLQKLTEKMGLSQNVFFLSKILDVNVLSALYSVCDLMFFPSTYDNTPIVVREACIMKLPTLLTIGSNAAEPFTDSVNGFLAEENVAAMAEKIRAVFANEPLRKAVGEEAANVPISFETMSMRSLERYKQVVEQYNADHPKKKQ